MLYKIKSIKHSRGILKGLDRQDGRYPLRIGRIVNLNIDYIEIGYPLVIRYIRDSDGTPMKFSVLKTSNVVEINSVGEVECDPLFVIVETENSIFEFEKMEEYDMKNYNEYIGKYYKRELGDSYYEGETYVFKIIDFDGKHFIVNAYGLYLGFSTLEINERLIPFFDSKDFKEIAKDEYELIKTLCIDPYVTEWNSENELNPKVYQLINSRELIRKNRF